MELQNLTAFSYSHPPLTIRSKPKIERPHYKNKKLMALKKKRKKEKPSKFDMFSGLYTKFDLSTGGGGGISEEF